MYKFEHFVKSTLYFTVVAGLSACIAYNVGYYNAKQELYHSKIISHHNQSNKLKDDRLLSKKNKTISNNSYSNDSGNDSQQSHKLNSQNKISIPIDKKKLEEIINNKGD